MLHSINNVELYCTHWWHSCSSFAARLHAGETDAAHVLVAATRVSSEWEQ